MAIYFIIMSKVVTKYRTNFAHNDKNTHLIKLPEGNFPIKHYTTYVN